MLFPMSILRSLPLLCRVVVSAIPGRLGGDDMSWSGWVAPGDYSPGAPTDPDVPNSGIRLLRLQNRCTTIHTVNDAR